MQSNNTLDGTNTTVDGANTSAPDSRPQKAAAKSDLRSLSSEQILELVTSLGQPKFRAKQIEEWIWSKGATSFDQMSNLPKTLREELSKQVTLAGAEQIVRQVSVMEAANTYFDTPMALLSSALACQPATSFRSVLLHRLAAPWAVLSVQQVPLVSLAPFLQVKSTSRSCMSVTTLTPV